MAASRRQWWTVCCAAILAGDAHKLLGALRRMPLACAASLRSAKFLYRRRIITGADMDVSKISLLGLATILGRIDCVRVLSFVLGHRFVSSLLLWDGDAGEVFSLEDLLESGSIMYDAEWCDYTERMYRFLAARLRRPVRIATLRL